MKNDSNLFPMNLQFFAEESSEGDTGEQGISTQQGLGELLNSMTQANEPQNQDTPDNQDTNTNENEGDANNEGEQQPTHQSQANYAFAQMRQQNNQLIGLLGKLAQAHGIEYKTSSELIEKLNDNAINGIAQKQNVPVELIKELEALKQDSLAFKAQQAERIAKEGFQNIMKTYGLTADEVIAYGKELDAAGINPFAQNFDIEADYKVRHFDTIVQKQVDAAVRKALAINDSADNSSTVVNKQQSTSGGEDKPISTMAGLNALLGEMK